MSNYKTPAQTKALLAHAKKWHAKARRLKAHYKKGGCKQTYHYWSSLEVHYAGVIAGCVGSQRKRALKKTRALGL